ncbi:hypothetical protein FAUST_11077 [Fusarium austroamericanum]|uniref:Zn(2)-C6 fungal-type domain-containing protein n=1 Tax=Fusarium austroamericanum TaxID=282268 RepID=A0AAN5Z0I3_FUSAU|nr:hypothetical protein FAUST_11077 [Fusarium austroamericanum]
MAEIICDQCRAKKIRCGREKPSCANCSRQGQKCEWSGQGKKFNQTAFLSRTVKELSSRLQILESLMFVKTSMLDNRGSLKRPRREPPSPSPDISALDTGYLRPPDPQSPDVERYPRFTRPLERFLPNHTQGLGERSFGPTSLEALMLKIKDMISGDLTTKTDKISEFLLSTQNKLRLPMSCGEEHVKDESPPTAPPRAILDAMIEPYFAEVNPQLPIWTREQFSRMTTALEQSSSPEQDMAAIVCCNNLILMTMTVNSLRSRWSRSFQTKHTYEASSVDSDITAGFLTNAKRAIKHIRLLLSPCLANVQALLSLHLANGFRNLKCVVAQEHLSSDYLESIFALAAQCAKSAGIHHWQSFRGHVSDKEVQERRNVSYCLYILDKAVGWTTGTAPSIPMSCLQMDSSFSPLNDDTTTHLLAKTELATIKEIVYLEEYSNQVKARTSDQVRHVVVRISQRLEDWLAKWHIDLDELENNLEQSPWKARLAIDFLCVQLLLLWPYQDHIDAIFQQQIDIARQLFHLAMS